MSGNVVVPALAPPEAALRRIIRVSPDAIAGMAMTCWLGQFSANGEPTITYREAVKSAAEIAELVDWTMAARAGNNCR